MELSYTNQPLVKIQKGQFLLVLLVTLAATFALWEFSVYFVGITVAIIFLASVYNLPELGVGVFVNGLYLVGYFWRGLEITYLITPLALVLCTIGLIHYVWNNGWKVQFGVLPGMVLLIGLMLLGGILYSPLPSQGLVKAGRYFSMNLFIFFAAMLFIGDLNKLKNLVKVIAFLGFVTAAISAVYVSFVGIETISRFTLPGQNVIWFSRGLGMSLLATLFWLELTKKKFEKLTLVVFICLMIFLIYITASRGPFLALLVALISYFFILQRRKFNLFKKILFILLILFSLKLSIAMAPGQVWNRMLNLFSGLDPTTFYRLQLFEMAKNLFFENPLKGVGTAGFTYFTGLSYPHNIFLEFACEFGVLGVLAIIVLIVYAAYLGIKLLGDKNASVVELNLSRFFLAIFIFSLINSQFSGSISDNYELWFSVAGIWTLHVTTHKFLKR